MRRLIDTRCTVCSALGIDVFVTDLDYPPCADCKGATERAFLPSSTANVISDECDVTVRHGICWPDGTPRRYGFKSEMKREAEKRGLVNHVQHLGVEGSDKSPHTTRWV
jgi:hypothetical protein